MSLMILHIFEDVITNIFNLLSFLRSFLLTIKAPELIWTPDSPLEIHKQISKKIRNAKTNFWKKHTKNEIQSNPVEKVC